MWTGDPVFCFGDRRSPAIAEYFASSIWLRSHSWYPPDHSVRVRFIYLTVNKLEQQQKRKEIPQVHLAWCILWPRTFMIVSLILTLNTLRCSLRPKDWKLKLRFTIRCNLRYCYYKTPGPGFGYGFISTRSKWWFGTQLLHWGDTLFPSVQLGYKIPLDLCRSVNSWLCWMTGFLLGSELRASCVILEPEWWEVTYWEELIIGNNSGLSDPDLIQFQFNRKMNLVG